MLLVYSFVSLLVIMVFVLFKELSLVVRVKGIVMLFEKLSVKLDKKCLNVGFCDDFIWVIVILGNSELKVLGMNLNKEFDNILVLID